MTDSNQITVHWTESKRYGDDSDWVYDSVIVRRGREQITVDPTRLRGGTLELAKELANSRERRRVFQLSEDMTSTRTSDGVLRHCVRTYGVMGLVP